MKANAASRFALPSWMPELALPSWMPKPIAEYVRAKYVGDIDRVYREVLKEEGYLDDVPDECIDWASRGFIDDDMVVRAKLTEAYVQDELADRTGIYLPLACDGRMESVWRELSKQCKRNGGFLHPAADKDELIAQHGGRRLKTAPSSKVNPKARQDAAMLELFKAALECRSRYRKPTALERNHDGRGRWVAITISSKFCEIFDSPMYGLTATITTVVLGRKIKSRTVRQWMGYPAYKPLKIAL
jgi:hypothetical protein